ncbi:hypothetical protein YALI2_A00612g [Yarrowia lipolytica]|nr:hypothetical protein YALI2_A00612g [Yarrowia lipolytica]
MTTYKLKVTKSTPYLRHKFPTVKYRDLLEYASASQDHTEDLLRYMDIMRQDFESNLDTLRSFVLDVPENNVALNQLQAEYTSVWKQQYAVLHSLLDCQDDDTIVEAVQDTGK